MVNFCQHCQQKNPNPNEDFCCQGCKIAFEIINKFGFSNYYQQRILNASAPKPKPEENSIDVLEFVATQNGLNSITLAIHGLHCAACVWLIESLLKKQKNVVTARINLSRKTLFLEFSGAKNFANELISLIQKIGYKPLPFDSEILAREEKKYGNEIVQALAIAGFGMGNLMLFSLIFWLYDINEIGASTRNLMQFFSALIALPVIIFAARPFFSSALKSLKSGFPNMDLAISIAIILASCVSLLQTINNANHIYFDSAVMLIFFSLIGRYLDLKARKKAFNIASEFSLLSASFGRVITDFGMKVLPTKNLEKNMILLTAAGEKIAADGMIIEGESEVDCAIINGESLPKKVKNGDLVFGGTLNLLNPLKIKITNSPENSLISKIIQLSEEVEKQKNSYIRIADRLAKFYLPAVHLLALATFFLWLKSGWEIAMMNATAVLIITCPCALALAVPIVQTMLISSFIKKGILVKSGEALEKLLKIDAIIFDKTGSITVGKPQLKEIFAIKNGELVALSEAQKKSYLKLAASLAKSSRHPISQAIFSSAENDFFDLAVIEKQGFGLSAKFNEFELLMGKADFCKINFVLEISGLKTFLKYGDEAFVLLLEDQIKVDAKEVIFQLKKIAPEIILLSGDDKNNVAKTAKILDIETFFGQQTPLDKLQFLQNLKAKNKNILMVGDGVNDAPALALADISISFSKASDISQNLADIVIQGEKLSPLVEIIERGKKSIKLMKQNLVLALLYNLIAVPFAVCGAVVPAIAAVAMSSSSLIVLFNSLRINR